MKYIAIIICLFLTGCFQHWEQPSSKLASQANNYLDNDKIQFFYGYCYRYGDLYNCLNKYNSLEDCKEELIEARNYQRANYENAKRFISFDSDYFKRLAESNRKFERIRENRDKRGLIEFIKESAQFTIDNFSDNYWPECREIAQI